jgi:hypothetical protein
MLSIFSGLLGIASSSLPNILGFFQAKADQKHELEMMKQQKERDLAMATAGFQAQEKIAAIEYESTLAETYTREREALYEHDKTMVESAGPFMRNLNASVRPIIAFTFVFELVAINFIGLWWAITTGVDFMLALKEIFGTDEMAILSSIIGFYFGSRQWEKHNEGK